MDFIFFLKRYLSTIIIFTVIFGSIGFWYGNEKKGTYAVTTLFLTVSTQDSSDPEQAEIASTYFGETIMGWFKNPVFIHSIIENIDNSNNIKISSYKQERQNLLIEIVASNEILTKSIADITYTELQKQIKRYNNQSNSLFVVIDQGRNTRIIINNNLLYTFAGILFGLFLSIFLFAFKEYIFEQVSSFREAEEILGVKTLDFLSRKLERNDLTILSVSIQKSNPIVILAGVNIKTDILAVALAHKHSYFCEKIALVDGDLSSRTLQDTLGLSNRMKNIKGHTDAMAEEGNVVNTSVIIQNTLDENLKFLPAGKGNHFLMQVFNNIALEMKTLIHTNLPENSEVLRLSNAELILVVKLGKTKLKQLKRIREVWKNDLKLVVVY